MIRFIYAFAVVVFLTGEALATTPGERALLDLCADFGETPEECRCYLGEVKKLYSAPDIALAGGVARAFLQGSEPESIAAYLLMTRKLTIGRAVDLYKLGDRHADRVADMCEDRRQKLTPAMKAKRDAMTSRLEKIGKRYRIAE
jgi:hypothetical protein